MKIVSGDCKSYSNQIVRPMYRYAIVYFTMSSLFSNEFQRQKFRRVLKQNIKINCFEVELQLLLID